MFSYVETINDDWVLRVTKDFYSEPISAPLVSEMLEIAAQCDREPICEFLDVHKDREPMSCVRDALVLCSNPSFLADLLIWLKENNKL
jgi:hypothetical protein